MGTVGSHDQSCKDKMRFLVLICLVFDATQANKLNKRSVVHAVPVVSTPAQATAGYAVGASGAVGGQAPATIAAPAPVVAYAGALPVAQHSAVAIASHAIPAEHHSVPIVPLTSAHPHGFSYGFTTHHLGKREAGIIGYHGGFLGGYLGHHGLVGLKSTPCVNVNNVPVPCAHPGLLHHGYLG